MIILCISRPPTFLKVYRYQLTHPLTLADPVPSQNLNYSKMIFKNKLNVGRNPQHPLSRIISSRLSYQAIFHLNAVFP